MSARYWHRLAHERELWQLGLTYFPEGMHWEMGPSPFYRAPDGFAASYWSLRAIQR